LLRSNCSLAALVDANERYDPPRCAEATRRDIIQKMEDWARHDSLHDAPSSILWLYGGAGAGKSALAQTLAERFKTNNDLAASFFFFKADANRNDGNRLIPTLSLQLVQAFEGLTPFVNRNILGNPDLFKKSRETQMLELLVEPLMRLSLEETNGVEYNTRLKSHPRLVVIDGLDECLDSNTQCDLLRIIAITIPHLPYPLRFLITSRPESHITRAFNHDVGKVARYYNLSDDSDIDNDIRNFLDGEFAKIRSTHPFRQHLPSQWPLPADVSLIVERSSRHFIYASTVIRFIQSSKHRPDDRLQVILGLKQSYEKDRPYARLDSLYSSIFLEIQDPSQLEKIHRALGIIYLRSLNSSGLFAWTQWTSDRHIIEVLLELRPGELVLLFDPLLSLVAFEKDNIRILHTSLFSYLLDSTRSREFHLD
jgi:dephospho-CoA kinase